MKNTSAKEILEAYKNGTLTNEQRELLNEWYAHQLQNSEECSPVNTDKKLKKVWATLNKKLVKVNFQKRYQILAAACTVIAVFALYHMVGSSAKRLAPAHTAIMPGGDMAYLTLVNGKTINLSKLQNGRSVKDGSLLVVKTATGEIVCKALAGVAKNRSYNVLSTPNGGQFKLILMDGTKVWLNAGSTLRYPTEFKKERNVSLVGEAYFEVAKDTLRPFHVEVPHRQSVTVLGTHFNINAYDTDSVAQIYF